VKTLLFALGTLALVGCKTNLTPVGPFAKEVPITQQGKPLPGVPEPAAKPPAIRPAPPTMYVTPGEVTADNPYVAAGKLTSELSADSKVSPNSPVTVEVSRVKGGIR
jgi:hypothetical protein